MKVAPNWGPIHRTCNCTKFSHHSDMVLGFVHPCLTVL